jgi:hypothetical protein
MNQKRLTAIVALSVVMALFAGGCGDAADDSDLDPEPLPQADVDTTDADDPTSSGDEPADGDPAGTAPSDSGPTDTTAAPSASTLPPGPLDPNDPNYPTIPPRTSVTYPSAG